MAGDEGQGMPWLSGPASLCRDFVIQVGATELAVTEEPGTQVLAEGPWAQSSRLIHLSLCVICLPSS